jgi:hypothetical protein
MAGCMSRSLTAIASRSSRTALRCDLTAGQAMPGTSASRAWWRR